MCGVQAHLEEQRGPVGGSEHVRALNAWPALGLPGWAMGSGCGGWGQRGAVAER